jgi:hypothetical protein
LSQDKEAAPAPWDKSVSDQGAASQREWPASGQRCRKEATMSEKFWLWTTAAVFAAVILGVLLYAVSITRSCEAQGGTMVRTLTASGWSCVQFPMRRDAPR